jgi:CRP/FNR family transcriptional regulator, cyclic AMP receptor protein
MRNVTIFAGLNDEDFHRLFQDCSLIEVKVGEVIIEENTPATEIFIILKGKISIVLNLRDNPLELAEFGPGNCIGEASVIGIQDHSASAVVMDDAVLMVLSRKVLMEIFEKDKALFSLIILNISREIARRLYHTDQILYHYGKNKNAGTATS